MNLCEQEVNVPDEFSVMTPVVIDHQSDCHRLTVDLKKKKGVCDYKLCGNDVRHTHTHSSVSLHHRLQLLRVLSKQRVQMFYFSKKNVY